MKQIITKDKSITFYDETTKETYHSITGAEEEATEKHAKALKIWEKNNPIIYDCFFGLGYNSAASIDQIRKHKNQTKIKIYCFENDKKILKKILKIKTTFESYCIIQNFIKNFLEKRKTTYKEKDITLIMFFGDIKQQLYKPRQNADYVFWDPFSPKKQPKTWTTEIFKDIKQHMNTNSKLSTYSYAKKTRQNLKETGFSIKDGPKIGRKTPSLIAEIK
ncbi:hypothetical protein K9L97_04485 [Candidatus Woesearchaeota archaeon]|nr:hypothetical protein [Candidatus Woesearchaeota archaeon]